jgi:hypothetical protein
MDAESLLAIATSIPLVTPFGDLHSSPEPRLDLDQVSHTQPESLMPDVDPEPRLKRRTGEPEIFTSEGYLYGFAGASSDLAEFVYPIPPPRLTLTDRPLLTGEDQERGRGFALWTHSGMVWRVEGQLTAEGAATLAADPIQRTSEFPTQ